MDYERLVNDLRIACRKIRTEVDEIWWLVPPSLLTDDVRGFYESLTWGDFFLPAPLNGKTPYLVWSLETRFCPGDSFACKYDFFVRMCDNSGEFGFLSSHALLIHRRTPTGWGVGVQQEKLVDMLVNMESRMASPDDIANIFKKIPHLYAEVPGRLKAFIYDKIHRSDHEAGFFFRSALMLAASLRHEREHIIAVKELHRSAERELREIAQGLRDTKSFAKSKVLRALRERCEKLSARLYPNEYAEC